MSRTMGLVAGTGVLTAVGAVVVWPVAGSVVVVVRRVKEVDLTSIAISDEGVSLGRPAAERYGDRVACGVASAHRLTPVAVHNNSPWSQAEKINPPQSGASI